MTNAEWMMKHGYKFTDLLITYSKDSVYKISVCGKPITEYKATNEITYLEVVLKWLDMENEEQIPVSTSLEHEVETTTDEEKHDQLAGRLYELSALNARIGNLTYYMNNNPMVGIVGEELTEQLDAMCRYRDALERRIVKGIY